MDRLRGRVILITGSTGIAAAAAARCTAEGAAVFVVSRSTDHAEGLVKRLAADGADVGWATADLADATEADGGQRPAGARCLPGGPGGSAPHPRGPQRRRVRRRPPGGTLGRPAADHGPAATRVELATELVVRESAAAPSR